MNRPIQGPDGDGEGESSVSQGPSGDLKKGRQRSVGCIDENAESKSALSAKVSAVEEEKGVGESGRSPSDADKKTGESTLTETVKTESAADKRAEELERERAMSRIYSQRNRDKQKRQIQELSDMKTNLEKDQMNLLATRRSIEEQLFQAQVENQMMRQQMMERRQQEVIRAREREMAELEERQRQREELFFSQQQQLQQQRQRMLSPYSTATGAFGNPMLRPSFGVSMPPEKILPLSSAREIMPPPPSAHEMMPPPAGLMLPLYDPFSSGSLPPNRMMHPSARLSYTSAASMEMLPPLYVTDEPRRQQLLLAYEAPMLSARRQPNAMQFASHSESGHPRYQEESKHELSKPKRKKRRLKK